MTVDQSKRILVVDDDPDVRELMSLVLGKTGLIVDVAANGNEALALVREHQHAVILLDLIMPVADGFAVLEGLQKIGYPVPPVVLVLTGADRRLVEQLDGRTIHGIVRKPFDPEEVAAIVVACTEIRNRSDYNAMAIAAMMAGGPIFALLNRFSS